MERKLEILLAITFDFSIEIINLCKELIEKKHAFLSKPLFESTTKMGVNINEAIEFHTNRTFLSKLAHASDEAQETLYWLKRIEKDRVISTDMHSCIAHCEQILKQINSATYT
jgi:four helix bundle protein